MGTWDDKPNDYEHALAIIKRQETALRNAKEYIEAQPRNEVSANVLAIIDGILTSPDYVP